MVKRRKIRAGTRVVGRFNEDKFYLGKIIKVKDAKLADVRFDGGDVQKDFEIKDLIIVDQDIAINAEPVPEPVAKPFPKKRKNHANKVVRPPSKKKQLVRKFRANKRSERVKQKSQKGKQSQDLTAASKKRNLNVQEKVKQRSKKTVNNQA